MTEPTTKPNPKSSHSRHRNDYSEQPSVFLLQQLITIRETQGRMLSTQDSHDKKITKVEEKIDCLDQKVSAIDKKLDVLTHRVDSLDKRVDSIDKRIDSLKQEMDYRFDKVDVRFDRLENVVLKLSHRMYAATAILSLLIVAMPIALQLFNFFK